MLNCNCKDASKKISKTTTAIVGKCNCDIGEEQRNFDGLVITWGNDTPPKDRYDEIFEQKKEKYKRNPQPYVFGNVANLPKNIPLYEKFDIPEVIRQYLPEEERFIEVITSCFEERPLEDDDPCSDEDYEYYEEECRYDEGAVDKITDIVMELIKGDRTIERDITVVDWDEFLENIKTKEWGVGQHWSYTSGKAVEGNEKDRYYVSMTAKITDPSAINYMGTYCHEQYDSYIGLGADEEIVLEEEGEVQLVRASVYDREAEKGSKYKFDDLMVRVDIW